MQTKPVNMKLPEVTRKQIADIKSGTSAVSNTAVVVAAVDLLYRYSVAKESIGQPTTLIVVHGDLRMGLGCETGDMESDSHFADTKKATQSQQEK